MTITADELIALAEQLHQMIGPEPETWTMIMDPVWFAEMKAQAERDVADWSIWWKRWWMRLRWGLKQSYIDAIKETLHRLETEEPTEITIKS